MRSTNQAMLVAAMLLAGTAVADEPGDALTRAIRDAQVELDFRYRYEFVDDQPFQRNAHAHTLRSRLGFAAAPLGDWDFFVEFDDLRHLGNDRFNDTRNGQVDRPQVPDPEGTDLNQVWVRYRGLEPFDIRFGRQRLARADERFIGGHAWRQNEQTFDSLAVDWRPPARYRASYAYVFAVNRIYGPERGAPARDLDTQIHLLDAAWDFGRFLELGGFVYLMDFAAAETFSNATLGLRATGTIDPRADLGLHYRARIASQQDHGSSRVSYDADYLLLEARLDWRPRQASLTLGYEVLGSGDVPGGGFRTPLASLHRFQGWSDRFAAASSFGLNDGIRDLYLGIALQLLRADMQLRLHDFDADGRSRDWGTELDFSASWRFRERFHLLVKYAGFDADEFGGDVSKFWLQLGASF